MNILLIRERGKINSSYKNYDVFDLLGKIECILAEYGFVGDDIKQYKKSEHFYRNYHGFKGDIKIIFVDDNSKLISLKFDNKTFRCPIYIERRGIPKSIDRKLIEDLSII